jgi:hypothetical protein
MNDSSYLRVVTRLRQHGPAFPNPLGDARAWVVQGIHSFQFLKLRTVRLEGECTDHWGEPWPKVRFTHDLFDVPAIGTPMRFSQLIFDVRAFRPAGFATQDEMSFPRSIRADKLPPIRNAVLAGITPTCSVVHV